MISELYQLSFNQVSEAILLTFADGTLCDANEAAIALLGISREQLLQKTVYDIFPNFQLNHWQGLQYNKKILFQEQITTAQETSQPIEVHAEYHETEAQSGASLLLKPTLTPQETPEELTTCSVNHLLELIINNIPQQIFWKDKNQVYLGCNRHFAQVVGLDNPEEIIGKNDYQLNRKTTYAASYREWDRRVIEQGQAILDLEEPYHHANGTEGVVLTSKVPLTDDQGRVFGLVGICTEITELKTLQQELAEANEIEKKFKEKLDATVQSRTKELQKTNQQLNDLEEKLREALATEKEINHFKTKIITTISHEYRTPLSRILIAANLIKKYRPQLSTQQWEKYLEEIFSAVQYLSNIVDDIVSFNSFPSQTRVVRWEWINLIQLYQSVITQMKDSKPIHHHLNLETDQDEIWMKGDKTLLSHLIKNFLNNAFQYSPPETTVTTRLYRETAQIILQVSDHGIGIPTSDQEKLFESFYRGSNVGNTPGTGLGLSIIRYIADIHEADITVESELGEGSTFTVRFPLPSLKAKP
ncbi:MAG: PAS domain-containing sensor histidine kinase [Halothece sp. Uz-M2-17]|nr:PAS domain-containing sensor histidine kinase [Halothece sp. Uz-M2-17]